MFEFRLEGDAHMQCTCPYCNPLGLDLYRWFERHIVNAHRRPNAMRSQQQRSKIKEAQAQLIEHEKT